MSDSTKARAPSGFSPPTTTATAYAAPGGTCVAEACADEATVAQHIEGHLDGAAGSGHPSPSPGGDHEDGDAHDAPSADCLCHLVYAPTTVAPDAVALRTPVRARFATDADRPPLVAVEGPEHVPLG